MLTGILLLLFGIASMSYSKNLVKVIMAFQVTVFGANLALFASGFGVSSSAISDTFVLLSIVVGASVEATGLAIIVSIHKKYGTLDPSEIRKLRH